MARCGPVRIGRFPCDCCGHWTLASAPDGQSLQLCPVCGWEDGEHWASGEGALHVYDAQRDLAGDGVAVALLRDHVRAATDDEQRDPRWQPYDGRRRALLARVEQAFEHVRLRKGLGPTEAIHQSRLDDGYGYTNWTPPGPGQWHPPDGHRWQDLTAAGVRSLFCGIGGMSFMDGRTFRFFLPAVARLYLQEQEVATRHDGPWHPLFHFTSIDARRDDDLRAYDSPQLAWLAELYAFATRPGSFHSRRRWQAGAPEAAAWRDHWRARLPAAYLDVYGDA